MGLDRMTVQAKSTAAYATDVSHYSHVVKAMSGIFSSVNLFRPYELDSRTYTRYSWLLLERGQRLLSRRISAHDDLGVRGRSIGPAQFLPLLGRTPVGYGATAWRMRVRGVARHIDRRLGDVEYFQFVDATGLEVLRRRERPQVSVCEYRNLHYNEFEQELEPLGGFPFAPRKHPIGDILDYVYDEADHIVVYSDVAKSSFVDRGYAPEKVSVVPLAVRALPKVLLPREPDEFTLVYVGRLDAYKGLDVAVAAVKELGYPYRLLVAGPGPAAVVEWLRRQPAVDYRGILSREELADVFLKAAALLAPSVESFGFAVLEAVSAGVPVIVRETTGAREFLPADLLSVVPGRDPVEWAAAVRSNAAVASSSPRSHPDLSRVLSWKRSTERQEEVIIELLRMRDGSSEQTSNDHSGGIEEA